MATFTNTSAENTFTGRLNAWDEVFYHRDYASGGRQRVVVNLGTGAARDGWGRSDRLTSIESVTGTRGNDVLTGSDSSNSFVGGRGADTITGGGSYDAVDYGREQTLLGGTRGVTINLATGRATDTFGTVDRLREITSVIGTRFKDILTGSGRLYVDSNGRDMDHEQFEGGRGADTINGGDGFDVVIHANDPRRIVANMERGTIRDGWGNIDRVRDIERVVGSAYNDIMTGNTHTYVDARGNSDEFMGFRGLKGNDTIDGGAGLDEAMYDTDPAGVRVDLAAGRAFDGWGTIDTLRNIERVRGSAYRDTLAGAETNNYLLGNGGADILDGRGGTDEALYHYDPAGVRVDLGRGRARDGWGNTDILRNIENARGSRFNDVLTGSSGNNLFRGLEGADTIDGGRGTDIAYYGSDAYAGGIGNIMVNLATGRARDGWGDTDVLRNIETATAGRTNDTLIGNGGTNGLYGREGRDTLTGGGGADTLSGGSGADRFVYQARTDGGDVITDFRSREGDLLVFSSAAFGGLPRGRLAASRFEVHTNSSTPTSSDIRFVFNAADDTLYFDSNGAQAGGSVRIATGFGMLGASSILIA